jgi:hypothetical protein
MFIESRQLLGRMIRCRGAGYRPVRISAYIIWQWPADLLKVLAGGSTDRFAGWLAEFGGQEDEKPERDWYRRQHRQDRQNCRFVEKQADHMPKSFPYSSVSWFLKKGL